VAALLARGLTNKVIGGILFISPATVRNHVHAIFRKTGAANRVGLSRLYSS
jgi:DNA-binding NarL/FixJ family response regulator